ncbi:hypothetical protein MYAM1_002431 [Malassezia yamatoensis]|uniref:SH3 domain-containing protein n=1 Tax=Malassezia yamatoensis TaxID=253288 RepID=A0AAJ6CJA7_9BASI|nr:hypothetical protein MYAM1_002431 [Malassezia yamatoensis]
MTSTEPNSGSLGIALVDSPQDTQKFPSNTGSAMIRAPAQVDKSDTSYTRQLVKDGKLSVRDFGYGNDDPRHHGKGTVIPNLPSSTPCVAIYDFQAESSNELSVSAGTQLYVIRDVDAGWVLAQRVDDANQRGLVPKAYINPID